MRPGWLVLFVLATGCTSSEVVTEPATFGSLEFLIPSGWHGKDLSRPGTQIAIWTPEDNVRHESVVLQRTPPMPAISDAGPETVRRLLDEAIRGLPGGVFGPPFQFRSQTGLLGVSVEGTFIPPGQDHAHRRIHAVLFEGTALVHVLFTAGAADVSSASFQIILDSLHRKEG